MYTGQIVFSQVMRFLPLRAFHRCVARYKGGHKVQKFDCLDQFLCMAFAQLTYRESLRDIEVCLRGNRSKLYHMGIRSHVARSTIADANEARDWRIYADFAQVLISRARKLYAGEDFGVELDNTVYALDATTIDLCLSRHHPCATVQSEVASRTLLQMDQAASAHQEVLRHERERGQDANLDRRLGLRPRGDHQEGTPTRRDSPHNPTVSERVDL